MLMNKCKVLASRVCYLRFKLDFYNKKRKTLKKNYDEDNNLLRRAPFCDVN